MRVATPRQAEFAGNAAFAFEPIDISRDTDASLLDAAMGFVEIDDRAPVQIKEAKLDGSKNLAKFEHF
jgi:hypothetical protein